jgi:hypothetical protein
LQLRGGEDKGAGGIGGGGVFIEIEDDVAGIEGEALTGECDAGAKGCELGGVDCDRAAGEFGTIADDD